ncbi:putative sodium-coupled neutral amino acid transporter 7 [Callorhinchus milii]|uniref:putative sodium-coupled neutral amino acid transporter 7 n=1 Tax=Callorhinchus milii TaxID=7868 RepID=UPI001C3F87F9|nr:putative sodium-coupled neutral amino acid transporter 7 [Callorhinchus milii]
MAHCDVMVNSDRSDWVLSEEEESKLLPGAVAESRGHGPGKPGGDTSTLGAVFIVVNAALGAGLLNFPYAFYMAGGVAAGIGLQMALLVFIVGGLLVLAHCSRLSGETTYQEVVRAVCGPVTGTICDILIVIYTFGTCIAFLIIIGDQLEKIISALELVAGGDTNSHWYSDRKFTISLTSILLILPLSIPKEIGFQRYASALSVMGTCYVTSVVIIKYIRPDQDLVPGDIPTSPTCWTAVFNAMPTICFGFQCHVSGVPVFNSMKRAELPQWGRVVTAALIICLFVYTGTGVCGFLTFGSAVNADVLLSYPSTDVPVAIARGFVTLCVLSSYPILHYCGRAVIEGLWVRRAGRGGARGRRWLQTLCWFFLSLILAVFIPDIGKVIAVIGGLAACFILVFPGLCLIEAKLTETPDQRPFRWWVAVVAGVMMVVLGAFIFSQSTVNAIYQDLQT